MSSPRHCFVCVCVFVCALIRVITTTLCVFGCLGVCLLCVFVVCLCVCVYTRVCVSALMCALCMCMCVCICPYSVIRYVRVGVDVYTTRTTERGCWSFWNWQWEEDGECHWASSATCTPDCEAVLIGFTRTHTHTRCESVHTHTHGGRRCSFTIYGSLYCFLELTMNTVFAVQDWRLIAYRLDSLHTQMSPLINSR